MKLLTLLYRICRLPFEIVFYTVAMITLILALPFMCVVGIMLTGTFSKK